MLQNEFPTVPDRDDDSGDHSDLLTDHFEHHSGPEGNTLIGVLL